MASDLKKNDIFIGNKLFILYFYAFALKKMTCATRNI